MSHSLTRRRFLRTGAGLAAAGALSPLLSSCKRSAGQTAAPPEAPPSPEPPPEAAAASVEGTSRVVVAHDASVVTPDLVVDRARLETLVDQALMAFSGEKSADKAWSSLFSTDECVGIKPNGIAGALLSTSTDLIEVCIDRLLGIGLKAENIVVWEQDDGRVVNCGLTPTSSASEVRKVGLNGYFSDPVEQGSFRGRISRLVTDEIDAILNLPIMKDHAMAGITLAMKNHYGTCDNPGSMHGNACDPYCADLNAVPAIRKKTRLIITDATRALYEGGPSAEMQFVVPYGRVLVARDPVAHDHIGWGMIDDLRVQNGWPKVALVGREPVYIRSAAQRGLGIDDPSRIEVVEKSVS